MKDHRTGILGGTFNPIHNQHLLLAECAYEQLSLEKILLIPSGISYLKKDIGVLPADIRYAMCIKATEDIDHFEVSDIEIKREGNSYTRDTLEELTAFYPDTDFYYIIGADTLFMLEKWKDPGYIFSHCILAVASRLDGMKYTDDRIEEKIREYEIHYDAHIVVIDIPVSGLSSSMIREAASKGEDISRYVPEKVADYISENGLYR